MSEDKPQGLEAWLPVASDVAEAERERNRVVVDMEDW